MGKTNVFRGLAVYRVGAGGKLVGAEIAPIPPDSLQLCARIVESVEAKAECQQWLNGQAITSRLAGLLD